MACRRSRESAADSPRGVEGWQVTLDQHGYCSIHVDILVDDFGVNGWTVQDVE